MRPCADQVNKHRVTNSIMKTRSPARQAYIDRGKVKALKRLLESNFDDLGWDTQRKRIIVDQNNTCNHCGITEWRGRPITLEIDHIDGISDNNTRENLEGLCPNCHSITDTWRGRNKPSINGNTKISDSELLEALESSPNIRQALLLVGLAAKGDNYKRAKKLLGS